MAGALAKVFVAIAVLMMTSSGIDAMYRDADDVQDEEYVRWESPGQKVLIPIVRALGEMADDVVDAFSEGLGMDLSEVTDGSGDADYPVQYATCAQCRTVVGTILEAVRAGASWELCRNVSLQICYPLIRNTTTWNEEIICPGVIDAYGIHIYYIFGITNYTAEEICQLYNNCPQDRPGPGPGRSSRVRPQASELRPPSQEPTYTRAATNEERAARRANAIKLLHLTDIHVDDQYLEGSSPVCDLPLCCRDGVGSAGGWGDYQCNIPPKTVELFMKFSAQLSPDLIVYTGDSPAHTVWDETQSGQLNVSRYIAETIYKYMPGVPGFPAIGNHDTYPTNLYYIHRPEIQEFNREYAAYWQPISNFGAQQLETLYYNGYFDMVARPGLRVISFNSNYGHADNFYNVLNVDGQDFVDMTQFMEAAFARARQNREKVLLLSHHTTGGSSSHLYNTDFLQDILRRNGDLVVLWLVGHSHGDSYEMLTDLDTGVVYTVQISSASTTSYTDINPSARLFYLDPVTYDVIDYDQFAMNLRAAVENGTEPTIELVYSFTTEYDLADGTPASFKELTDKFETNDELYNLYRYHGETRTSVPGHCNETCRANHLCDIRTIAYDARQTCEVPEDGGDGFFHF